MIKLLPLRIELELQTVQHCLQRHCDARAVLLLRYRLRSRVKGCLHAPEGDCVAHGRFDEVGQGLALLKHRLEFGTQSGIDADLGFHSSFYRSIVLRLGYRRNDSDLT